jgi:hypothetical protein
MHNLLAFVEVFPLMAERQVLPGDNDLVRLAWG